MVAGALAVVVLAGTAVAIYVRVTGLSALSRPPAMEAGVARAVRGLAIPASVRALRNPLPHSSDSVEAGLQHYADHCASCHANDGSGQTAMGRGLYPKPPDMRLPATQDLTDGELFHVIEQGIRFTGMPGWRTGEPAGETATWQLVHFLRELPRLTPAQIERMSEFNPRPPADVRQEIEEEQFLGGQE